MSKVMNSREMCEMILSSSDATAAEKRVAQVRLDQLDAGDESQVYIRLDSADDTPDRGAIVAAIKKLDPAFEDSPTLSLGYLQGRLDQMQASHVTATMTTTSKPHAPIARTDAFETALITARNAAATAWCSTEAEKQATVSRLDAATAHEVELQQYRAERTQETKLDASKDDLGPVVKAAIEYHNNIRSLSRTPSGGFNGGGPSAA